MKSFSLYFETFIDENEEFNFNRDLNFLELEALQLKKEGRIIKVKR